MMKFVVVILFIAQLNALRLTDKIAKDAGEILTEAQTDKTIRQCECKEQHDCFDSTKHQLFDCFEECWGITKQITNDTNGLRKCLTQRIPIIENFFGCLETNLNSCSDSKTADNITYIDYNKVINNVENRIHKQTTKLTKSVGASASKLINVVLELGTCVKDCFVKKNSDGFCFDKKSCQSKIVVDSAVKSLKKCAANIKWKQTAFETCECAVGAGVTSVQQYCNLLKTNERSRNSRRLSEIST